MELRFKLIPAHSIVPRITRIKMLGQSLKKWRARFSVFSWEHWRLKISTHCIDTDNWMLWFVLRWDGWMASPTQWTQVWVRVRELRMDREAWRAAVRGVAKSQTRPSNWTEGKKPWSTWTRVCQPFWESHLSPANYLPKIQTRGCFMSLWSYKFG